MNRTDPAAVRGQLDSALSTTIDVIDDAGGFHALREEWTELLASSESDSLFLTWEWLYSWWNHFGSDRGLFIVTVRAGEQLIAIAPLTARRSWSMPLLEFAGTGIVGSDYLDVIVRRGCESDAIPALAEFLSSTGTSLRLPRVRRDSSSANALAHALGWRCITVDTEVCPFIDLSNSTFDDYLRSIGASHRYNFRRRLRNLTNALDVRLRYATTDDERRQMLSEVIRLHMERWEKRGGSDAFEGAAVLAFHEEFSQLALDRGWLRLSVLELDGKTAAAFYCFRYRGAYLFYQSGFDAEFERHSVGLVTMGLTIRDAIAEGASEFDFLHGDESYKFLWTSTTHQLIRLELYPPGHLGDIQRNAMRVKAATGRLARRVLSPS